MIATHSLKLSRDDFNYDMTPGFEMGVEKQWHVIDPTAVVKNVNLYDSDLVKLYNDDRYGIRLFYKLVIPLSYFSDSEITKNPLLDNNGKFTFDNGIAIGNPTLSMIFPDSAGELNRGLLISEETMNNNTNYNIPDEWAINHTYTKRDAFATGTSIASLNINTVDNIYTQQQNTNISSEGITYVDCPFIFAAGDLTKGGLSSININETNVAYTVTTEGNRMNVPNGKDSDVKDKLMPLLFKPFGMSWCSNEANQNIVGWMYCVLGVKQMMSEKTYTVRFLDYNNKVIKQQTVQEGTAALPPTDPVRVGYNFAGWKPTTYKDVLYDQDVQAQYVKEA